MDDCNNFYLWAILFTELILKFQSGIFQIRMVEY